MSGLISQLFRPANEVLGPQGWALPSSGRGLWSAAIAGVACAYLLLAGAMWASATPGCTHGVSSIGPVELVNGHLTRDATPDTQACLP
jgi:hypothetical protein